MGLRLKVVLTLVALVVPMTAAFMLYRINAERSQLTERFADRIATRLTARPRLTRCERRPRRFSPGRRGFRVFPYDSQLRPLHPKAPDFPEPLRAELAEVEAGTPVHAPSWSDGRFEGATAVRHPGGARCAAFVIGWPSRRRGGPGRMARRVLVTQSLAIFAALLVVGLLISIPLVRRIRRLTEAVRAAPERDWRVEEQTDAGDELGELARAFDETGRRVAETIDELERRDRTLQEYIANTTHDLAIPLTVLQHRLRRLREDADDATREQVDTALEESHYIASLISNMSAAARLDAEHRVLHEVDLREVVERVVGRHEPIARQRDIKLQWSVPPEPLDVQADSTLAEQALGNLVQNAVQYNTAGGHVSVVLEALGARFELRVLDDGPGIPAGLREKITARGLRGGGDGARSRNPGGQGFGLSIARRVCELHGWEIELDDGPDGGLEVTISGALDRASSAEA